MKKALFAALAILGLGAAAMLVVVLAPVGSGPLEASSAPPSGSVPAPPPPPPSPQGAVPGSPAPGAGAADPRGPVVLPQVVYAPADPPPPPGSWEAVKPVARPSALGPVGAAVSQELNELQPELSACFDEVTQSRFGQQTFTQTAGAADPDGGGTPVLMLQLEIRRGEVAIVDAPVDARGGASDGLIACAQSVLRGRVVKVPQAKAGGRARMVYSLVR